MPVGANFTHNEKRYAEFSAGYREIYVRQTKGLASIVCEWTVVVLVACFFAGVWIYFQQKWALEKQKINRAKGFK